MLGGTVSETDSGVVHAAGVMDRCPLPDLDGAHLNKASRGKKLLTWTKRVPRPKSFAMVGSTGAGSKGQRRMALAQRVPGQ